MSGGRFEPWDWGSGVPWALAVIWRRRGSSASVAAVDCARAWVFFANKGGAGPRGEQADPSQDLDRGGGRGGGAIDSGAQQNGRGFLKTKGG